MSWAAFRTAPWYARCSLSRQARAILLAARRRRFASATSECASSIKGALRQDGVVDNTEVRSPFMALLTSAEPAGETIKALAGELFSTFSAQQASRCIFCQRGPIG
eukprot:8294142-Pyramimonas_sp.AAC.1